MRARDEPDPPQAPRRGPPRGRAAARPRHARPTNTSATGSAKGASDDPAAPAAVKLEILPGPRVLNAPARPRSRSPWSPITPTGRAATSPRSATTTRPNPEIADVDAAGHVTFKARGEVAIIAHYLDLVANVRLTHLVEVPGFAAAEVPKDNTIDAAVFAKLNRMRIRPSEPCTDAEFIRRAYARLPRRPARARGGPRIRRRRSARQAGEAGRSPAGSPRVPRLLDPEVRRHPPRQRPADPDQGGARLQPLDPGEPRAEQADGPVRPRAADGRRLDLSEPGGELLPDQPRPRELGRDHRAALPGRAHPVREVPQPPVRALDAGRLLRLRGVLLPGPPQAGEPARGGGHLRGQGRRRPPAPDRQGDDAEGPGRPGIRPRRPTRPATAATRWRPGSPGPDNPFFARSLVNRVWFHLMGRGIVEPVDDFRDSNPASNDELLDALAGDFAKNGYRPQASHPLDPHQPDLSAQRPDERAERGRRDLFLARLHEAPARPRSCSTRSRPSPARPRRSTACRRGRTPRRSPTARWTTRSSRPSAARPASWPASASARATPTCPRPSS